MDALLREITDFRSLQDFVSENEGNLMQLTKRYYCELGSSLGFQTKKDFAVKFRGIELGCLSLLWFDSENEFLADATNGFIAFDLQFGNRSECLASIFKLAAFSADYSVLVTSAKAKNYSLLEIKSLLAESSFLSLQKPFLLIDLSTERFELIEP